MTITDLKDETTLRIMRTIELIRQANHIIDVKKNSVEPTDHYAVQQYTRTRDRLLEELSNLLHEAGIYLPVAA